MEQLYTCKQVATYLQISLATVYRLLASGRLRGVHVSDQKHSNWRIKASDLQAYLETKDNKEGATND